MSVQYKVFILGDPSENPSAAAAVAKNKAMVVFISQSTHQSILQYEDKYGFIEQTHTKQNLFIDVGTYRNVVEFRVQNPTVHREALFKQARFDEIPSIIAEFENGTLTPTYDIFSGEVLDGSPELKKSVSKHLKIFMFVLTEFLEAGYYDLENKRKVQDWCICFSDPIMDYFINYFEIKTQSPDIPLVDEFLTNPQFRQMITESMLHVAAHYAVNHNIISHVELLNTSWSDTNIIKKIQSSLN